MKSARTRSLGVSLLAWPALPALLLVVGCARRGPPTGGPPDLVAPKVESSVPDSGSAKVAPDGTVSLTFTKPMEPRTTGEAVSVAPYAEIRQRRWHGKTLTLTFAQPLKPRQTYTLFVGLGARDHHGNGIEAGRAIAFSTADTFPAGSIEGEIQAMGFPAPGTSLWVYGGGRAPDSTARDFDALAVADAEGAFRVPGLVVPGRYRLWGFADLNRNRSFEPATDVLAPADTVIELTPEHPSARGLKLRMTNPRAPGMVKGSVADSTGDTLGVIRLVAISEQDSTRRVVTDARPNGTFELNLQSGPWSIRAWRDEDKNRAWRVDLEPASDLVHVDVEPAGEVANLVLRLRRRSEP